MDIRLLETFRMVIDQSSATAAAAALGLTQPAVSSQIARLEDAVGFPLFERSGGRLRPTPEGLLFYTEATKALDGFDRLTHAAEQIRSATAGRLVVASHPSAAISLLPPVVSAFVSERPGVLVRLVTRASDVVSRLLPSETFEIGIAEPPIDSVLFAVKRFRFRCVAVLPKGHRLARRSTITPHDLSGEPFVATWRASLTYQRTKEVFAAAGADLAIAAETEFFASALGLVAGGAGVAIVDPLSAATPGPAVVVREFAPAIPYEICVFHGRELSLLGQAFLDALLARLGTHAEEVTR
jgi:DNA-binding transcriptional LysR family regulator